MPGGELVKTENSDLALSPKDPAFPAWWESGSR